MEHGRVDTSRWKRCAIAFVFRAAKSKCLNAVCRWDGGVLILPSVCIKSRRETSLSEAHAMEFVRTNTSIPVPKVYHAFEWKGRVYIIMQRIKAPKLGNLWVHLSDDSKERIFEHLRTVIEQLRNLRAAKGTGVANIDGGPIFDPRLPGHSNWGPFSCIEDFHNALVDHQDIASITDENYGDLRELAAFYRKPWPHLVFTHGDLSSLNILCAEDKLVGIIDWETAGWLPPYWEYVTAWNASPQNAFWQAEVDRFLQPWPDAQRNDTVRRKYFGLY